MVSCSVHTRIAGLGELSGVFVKVKFLPPR